MSAVEHLSGPQFFHGTRHTFNEGQIIDPQENTHGVIPDKHMYFTNDLGSARVFAHGVGGPPGDFDAKPRVYKVQPLDDYHRDPNEEVDRTGMHYRAYRTPGKVRVIGEVPR